MEETSLTQIIPVTLRKSISWIRNNPKQSLTLALILLLAAFLRLYRVDQYMTFLGDEGRDAIIVRRLLVNFDPILIGPGTSIGNMYLGPLYYYLISPALLLANFSPAGPAVMIGILGVITVWLVWYVAKTWFGTQAAITASILYAISPTVITYSRSSWNPNIMPFFALLSIWSIWQVWQKKSYNWLIVLGISLAFVLQSHYLGLLLIPTVGFFWMVSLKNHLGKHVPLNKSGKETKSFYKLTIVGILIFTFLMSPLVIFDARHGWRNFEALKQFLLVRQTTVSVKPWSAIPQIPILIKTLTTRLTSAYFNNLGLISAIVVVAGSIITLLKSNNKKSKSTFILLTVWITFALIGLGVYKQNIYDHYFGFIYPAPFLLLGGLVKFAFDRYSSHIKFITTAFIVLLIFANISQNPLRNPPNRQLQRTEQVAALIREKAEGKPFNLAVIAERNYEDAYQYFLEKWGTKVTDIDSQIPSTITDQLFVVCELPINDCDPTHNAKAEVANFGWSTQIAQWEVSGVTIFKLIHAQVQ